MLQTVEAGRGPMDPHILSGSFPHTGSAGLGETRGLRDVFSGKEAVGILHFKALALDSDRSLDLNPLLLPAGVLG